MCAPLFVVFALAQSSIADRGPAAQPLPPMEPDARSAAMVEGISRFLDRKTAEISVDRQMRWEAMARARFPQAASLRLKLRSELGLSGQWNAGFVEPAKVGLHVLNLVAETDDLYVASVRWECGSGVVAEGLNITPKRGRASWRAICVPDSGQTPEMICGLSPGLEPASQYARLLAEAGAEVVVPTVIDRGNSFSGSSELSRFTKQPHREWIYRQCYEVGRHLFGYEAVKILAAAKSLNRFATINMGPLLLVGHGEGGLLALYAAAMSPETFHQVYVGGVFRDRSRMFEEPIWRNAFGLLTDFDDAEAAALVFPSRLWVDDASVDGANRGAWRAAPGETPGFVSSTPKAAFEKAVQQARKYEEGVPVFSPKGRVERRLLQVVNAAPQSPVCPGLEDFLKGISEELPASARVQPRPVKVHELPDAQKRQRRQVEQLTDVIQREYRASERARRNLWKDVKPQKIPADKWAATCAPLREKLRKDVIGEFNDNKSPPNPRARKLRETPKWVLHEVVLDVWPEVFAWGYLLLPKDLKEGERRPVVVCQHGLEGLPEDTVTDDPKQSGFGPYQAFSARLAERGFIVFAPHNPYRGHDRFRVLQRKANPLGRSLFSIIVGQHEVITEWLAGLPFVDPTRIGFYGLSYGGKTAMRVPALVDRYRLSICSADFNDWIRKNVVVDDAHSYMYTGEYEMPEFNLGRTFNYAEMAALIAPRPFMVERGHHDGVAPDEWVAYEFAKVRRLYAELHIPERTEIEFFLGPHQIHGVGTYEFLHRHLNWPKH